MNEPLPVASEAADLSPRVWDRIACSPWRELMLDFDGTLAPFRAERIEARVPADTLGALRSIATSGCDRVTIVSGRPVAELRPLLPDLEARLVGEHGWEDWRPGSEPRQHALDDATALQLARAARAAHARGWGPFLERKRCSLVLHTRGLDAAHASQLERLVSEFWWSQFLGDGLSLENIHGGLELRATARHKGVAVAETLRESPAGALVVYVGDDRTDEDAFEVVAPRGLAIRVGAPGVPSHAPYRLDSPGAVGRFLRRWAMGPPAAADGNPL